LSPSKTAAAALEAAPPAADAAFPAAEAAVDAAFPIAPEAALAAFTTSAIEGTLGREMLGMGHISFLREP
jgi:hypothetical protein